MANEKMMGFKAVDEIPAATRGRGGKSRYDEMIETFLASGDKIVAKEYETDKKARMAASNLKLRLKKKTFPVTVKTRKNVVYIERKEEEQE